MKGVRERMVVQLDEVASKLVRRYTQGKNYPCVHSGADPRDVASAAVVFFLDDEDGTTDERLHAATARRERAEGRLIVQSHPPVAVDVDVEAAELLARLSRQTGQDARDVASGMLYFVLARALWGKTFDIDECITSAKGRRLSRTETESLPKVKKAKAVKSGNWPKRAIKPREEA